MRPLRIVLLLATLACALPLAQASTIYLYVGNDFQVADNTAGAWASTSQYITGWFMVAAPLPANSFLNLTPLEWSLSDGLHTLDQSTPDVNSFNLNVITDGSANFIDWTFAAGEFGSGPDGTIGMTLGTTNFQGTMQDLSVGFFPGGPSTAINMNAPGGWSSVTIPEPGTIGLSAAGGLLLLACFWKRRRPA